MGRKSTATRYGAPQGGTAKVGRIGKLFGSDGGVTLSLYDSFPEEWDTNEPLWVFIDSLAVPLFTEHFERRGKSGALVRFADINTVQRAEELVGLDFYLSDGVKSRSDDGVGLANFEGYSALIEEEGREKMVEGAILSYVESGSNPLFTVGLAAHEVLIPASEDFIERVDVKGRKVYFTLPAGLLDLNE